MWCQTRRGHRAPHGGMDPDPWIHVSSGPASPQEADEETGVEGGGGHSASAPAHIFFYSLDVINWMYRKRKVMNKELNTRGLRVRA